VCNCDCCLGGLTCPDPDDCSCWICACGREESDEACGLLEDDEMWLFGVDHD
jgi:hypothetical protein